MNFSFYRIFCATPSNAEKELEAFHDAVAEVNQEIGQAAGSLLVPVCLPAHIQTTEVFRAALDANVRECAFFVQVLRDGWGPPQQRNFQAQFQLACELLNDSCSPMKGVAAFVQETPGTEGHPEAARLKANLTEQRQSAHMFRELPEFRRLLVEQFTQWLQLEQQGEQTRSTSV
jgi:hypothetical protein